MLTASSMYALNINECASLIENVGPKRTVVVRGDMGWGKTSILKILKQRLGDKYAYAYFDCTTKMDSGDIHLPDFATTDDGMKYVRYVPTEEYGLHYGKPVVLCIDEIGKAEKGTKNALMRDMLERDRFIAGSIIFATTNHALEKVGDILMPHHRNRLIVVTMRKSKQDEWIENFAYAANIHPAVISWVGEHPELFQSFMDLMDDKGEISKVNRDSNPMIYIPGDVDRESFVTGRSLEAASDVVHALENRVTDKVITAALIGTIGAPAAQSLATYLAMLSDLPKLNDIKSSPHAAHVPNNTAAACMVVHRTLAVIERNWMDSWMEYMMRLPKSVQGLFAMTAKKDTYHKRSVVMTNSKFQSWALANNYLTTADKI